MCDCGMKLSDSDVMMESMSVLIRVEESLDSTERLIWYILVACVDDLELDSLSKRDYRNPPSRPRVH